MMILDLHRQGLSPTAIARQLGIDRKTVRKYIARGMDPPNWGPDIEVSFTHATPERLAN
jgi:DNA-binding NarL/FixJ family response regulator